MNLSPLNEKMLHGGDYNPDQWLDRPDILKQDIKETAETENVTAPLFTRVYLDKGIEQDKETKRLPKFNIKITAYAIQADGITYDDAKTEMMEYVNNRSVEGL